MEELSVLMASGAFTKTNVGNLMWHGRAEEEVGLTAFACLALAAVYCGRI
jgi:hypothetical protein